jgi:hypothetical protein
MTDTEIQSAANRASQDVDFYLSCTQGEIIEIEGSRITILQPRGTLETAEIDESTEVRIDGMKRRAEDLVQGHVVQAVYLDKNKSSPLSRIDVFIEFDPPVIPRKPALKGRMPE